MLGKSSKDEEENKSPRRAIAKPVGEGVSLISSAMRVVGDCRSDGQLRIEGHVTGDVIARGVEVASSGTVTGNVAVREGGNEGGMILVEGTVQGTVRGTRVEVGPEGGIGDGLVAGEVVIHGRVEGGIVAEQRLVLEETAVVEGDVRALRIAVKEGGQVNGTIRMGKRAADGDDEEESADAKKDIGTEANENQKKKRSGEEIVEGEIEEGRVD